MNYMQLGLKKKAFSVICQCSKELKQNSGSEFLRNKEETECWSQLSVEVMLISMLSLVVFNKLHFSWHTFNFCM